MALGAVARGASSRPRLQQHLPAAVAAPDLFSRGGSAGAVRGSGPALAGRAKSLLKLPERRCQRPATADPHLDGGAA